MSLRTDEGSRRFRLSQKNIEKTHLTIENIRNSSNSHNVAINFLSYASQFGARHLLAGTIPRLNSSRSEQISHILLDAWPKEWSRRYFSNGYLFRDPTIRLVNQGASPFHWRNVGELCSLDNSARRVMNEATEFNLNDGFTIAFSTIDRTKIGFSIAGEELDVDPDELPTLQFVAAYASGCAISQTYRRNSQTVHLSQRQYDVLRWAAEGLTVEEIARKLNISGHTADAHLRAVRAKLGVTSTIHAVAEAFRIGLLG